MIQYVPLVVDTVLSPTDYLPFAEVCISLSIRNSSNTNAAGTFLLATAILRPTHSRWRVETIDCCCCRTLLQLPSYRDNGTAPPAVMVHGNDAAAVDAGDTKSSQSPSSNQRRTTIRWIERALCPVSQLQQTVATELCIWTGYIQTVFRASPPTLGRAGVV